MQNNFNEIIIIESLPASEPQTGTQLYGDLTTHVDLPIVITLARPHTAADLLDYLYEIAIRAANGDWCPLLHFEMHGSAERDGVVTASGERISWRDVAVPLRHLNVAVRNSLIVVLGVCSGAFIATAAATSPFEPAPFCWLVGPTRPVVSFFLSFGFKAFYSELKLSGNFPNAVAKLRQYTLPEYTALDVARIFRIGWRAYEERDTTGDALRKRVKRIFRRQGRALARQHGGNNKARAAIAAHIQNTSTRRDKYYNHFIMADKFPENAQRFPALAGA